MKKINILWIDDEIDLLKPHILFLEEKGYQVKTINNSNDALELIQRNNYDIIFLDEQMPGLSGIETLERIKNTHPHIPIIMITKSEEENIMEEAIGSKISDYLIKPVKPSQILLAIKKNIETEKLISEKTSINYQKEFREIGMRLNDNLEYDDWVELYKKIVHWDIELQESGNTEMADILQMQKEEANTMFGKFIEQNYPRWLNIPDEDSPILSHNVFKKKINPLITNDSSIFLLVIDNLRYDQWEILRPVIRQYFTIEEEDIYYSILPTSTQYARNAIFAGLLPSEIEKMHPKLWSHDEEKGSKNLFEEELLNNQMRRLGKNCKVSYNKILNIDQGKNLADNLHNLLENNLNVIVYNFVDTLSHARTEMDVIKELVDDEAAYRSITLSWLKHSPLLDILIQIAQKKSKLIITTDHGSIKVKTPSKVIGDKETSTNLRFKHGKSLKHENKNVYAVKDPSEIYLPGQHFSSSYIIAKKDLYFVYQNNYNYYANYYKNTFQHGGISLEEMLIPIITLTP